MKLAKEERKTIAKTERKREVQRKERKYESVSGALQS